MGWIGENRILAAGIAAAAATAMIGVGVVAVRSGNGEKRSADVVAGATTTVPTVAPGTPGPTTTATAEGATTSAPGATGAVRPGGRPAPGGTTATTGPGGTAVASPGAPCTPRDVKATGITRDTVVIGQIVSDVSILPAQLKPNYEGLQAYVNTVNAAGGVCGRRIVIKYSNDQANPATHDYASMAHEVFAFVANSSLIDQVDYQSDAPFNPTTKDNGEYVPDIGGLAYSYGRSQSPWHAGVIGSVSPALTGGGQFRHFVDEARAAGRPCRKAGVVYLREPTGASEDQGRLGGAALAADWGANLGASNVKYYVANLADPVPVYQQMVATMVADGVNCVFTYADLGSNINLVKAAAAQGVWPPRRCSGQQCFSLISMPFAGYDPKFIRDAGDASLDVSTFLPHLPLNETANPAMRAYLDALRTVPGARPSTFSIIGYLSGRLFVDALRSCGAAPTRACVMDYARRVTDFDGGGLQGPVTPFRATRVDCSGGCGNFGGRGVYNFKWIFTCSVAVRVADRGGVRDFYRIHPATGYACDQLHVARGRPA